MNNLKIFYTNARIAQFERFFFFFPSTLTISNEEIETEVLLDDLISSYSKNRDEHISNKLMFKANFEIVFKSLKKYAQFDLPIDMEYFSGINKLSNEASIEKSIYELFNYQKKIKDEKRNSTLKLEGLMENTKLRATCKFKPLQTANFFS